MRAFSLLVNSEIEIPYSEFQFSFARSSGPGGQNVNKVNSKAVLHWNALESPSLPPHLRQRILTKLSGNFNADGFLVIMSDRFRDQPRNREDCLEKLAAMIREASVIPKPRKKTKPSKSSRRKAAASKQKHSQKKKMRGARHDHS